MNVKGRRINMNTVPDSTTITENIRPRSEWNDKSPYPSVDIVTIVQ